MTTGTAREYVRLQKQGEIAILSFSNPPMNTLCNDLLTQLQERVLEVKNDNSVKLVVIKGENLFSVGAEVREIYQLSQSGNPVEIRGLLSRANAVVDSLDQIGKPTVAALQKYCLGGGNEIAMACTYRFATPDTKIGQPEINLGIIPGMGGTQRLPRLVGLENALPLLLSGKVISAKEAKEIGLVDEISPDDKIGKFILGWYDKNRERILAEGPLHKQYRAFTAGELDRFPFPKTLAVSNPAVDSLIIAMLCGLRLQLAEGLSIEQDRFTAIVMTEATQDSIAKFLKISRPKKTQSTTETDPKPPTAELEHAAVSPDEDVLKSLRDLVREFAEKRIRPNIAKMEKENRVLPELIKEMADMGLYGVPFPETYGGINLGLRGYCVMMEELCRVHGSTAVMVGASVSLGGKAVYMYGTEDQKQRWLVPVIKGEKIGAYATTEPSIGSDVANIRTKAEKVDGGWRLTGDKQFITNGAIADFVIVFAQTGYQGDRNKMAAFIVNTKAPGFEITKVNEEKMGIHASCTSAFHMENVFVPDADLLGQVGAGFKIAMNIFNQSRISLGASCLGSVKAALEESIKFVKDRESGGEPLYMKQSIQMALAKIQVIAYDLEQLVYNTAALYDKGSVDIREAAAVVKYWAAERSFEAIDIALQIHGGAGYIADYPIERIFRDIRVNRIFEGTSEIQLLLISKELLKRTM